MLIGNSIIRGVIGFSLWSLSLFVFALRDPTQPMSAMADTESGSSLTVKMIKVSNGQASAYINDAMVKVGDTIYGMKVEAIEHDVVIFRIANGRVVSLPLYRYIVEKKKVQEHETKK